MREALCQLCNDVVGAPIEKCDGCRVIAHKKCLKFKLKLLLQHRAKDGNVPVWMLCENCLPGNEL